jgi:hypothetical protein
MDDFELDDVAGKGVTNVRNLKVIDKKRFQL